MFILFSFPNYSLQLPHRFSYPDVILNDISRAAQSSEVLSCELISC